MIIVSGKVDYSNQILLTSDDWEVDVRKLKFASHIGQGAFGKVVTGYYDDKRVAIKLVRGMCKYYLRVIPWFVRLYMVIIPGWYSSKASGLSHVQVDKNGIAILKLPDQESFVRRGQNL